MNKTLGDRFLQVLEKTKPFPNSSSANNLPSISLNQLEKQVNIMKKKRYIKQNGDDSLVTNNKEFKVCSPFYDRMKAHKQNCKCPFHKKQRFSLLPVRHSQKLGITLNTSFQKPEQNELENTFYRFSSKQGYQSNKVKIFNKSLDQLDNSKLSHTQEFAFKPKVDTRNITYKTFLKDCQYHLLNKRGFSLNKPSHIVRKGVKEIFQFINNHLDYTVDKMTQWVNTIEKDKDYGEFYVQRFKQMKQNYEMGSMKRMTRTQLDGKDGNYFSKANNSTGSNFRSKETLSALRREKRNKQLENTGKDSQSNFDSNKRHSFTQGEYEQNAVKMSQIFLNKIFSELKNQNTISIQSAENLMKMDGKQFKQLFSALQKSLLSQKYTDEMLQKFDSGVLSELMKRYSNSYSTSSSKSPSKSSSVSDIKSKLDVIKKTQQMLRKHRSRKISLFSQNSLNLTSNTKPFLGSKRNTQNAENSKNNTRSHSKKSSNGDCSLSGDSQKYLNDSDRDQKFTTEVNFQAIDEQNQFQDQNLSDAQRMLKAIVNFGPKARRSKVFRPQDLFNYHNQFRDDQDGSESQFEKSKRVIQLHKGIFKKAQRYLFDINMGKTIIKKDDSLFTAKRKMRVIKALLKQNPNSPQADQLRSYVKQIEQKIYLKTQKEKKHDLQKKSLETPQIEEVDPWKQISLDNLGYNLIFYNLTSKIGTDDNEDLCILLNQWKLGNQRKFEKRLSFHLNLVTDDEDVRKSKKKTQVDDILVQQGMRNMEFQPELQSEKQIDIKNQSKRTTKIIKKSLLKLNTMAKDSKLSGFFKQNSLNQLTEDQLNRMNNSQIQAYHSKIKKIFKYAKVRFPQTFDKYVKNSLAHNFNNEFQNSDMDFSVFTY